MNIVCPMLNALLEWIEWMMMRRIILPSYFVQNQTKNMKKKKSGRNEPIQRRNRKWRQCIDFNAKNLNTFCGQFSNDICLGSFLLKGKRKCFLVVFLLMVYDNSTVFQCSVCFFCSLTLFWTLITFFNILCSLEMKWSIENHCSALNKVESVLCVYGDMIIVSGKWNKAFSRNWNVDRWFLINVHFRIRFRLNNNFWK